LQFDNYSLCKFVIRKPNCKQ